MTPTQIDLQHTKEHKEMGGVAGLHKIHWLVIFLSFILTLTAWYFTKQQVENKIQRAFDVQAEQVVELVRERMRKYEDALWAGVATVKSQSFGIDRLEWRRFANALRIEDRYKGINGIGIINYVLPEDLESFIETERKFKSDFKVYPEADRKEYLPITFIEPEIDNMAAIGLDMAHESNRYKAALKARKTGLAQMTAPITLVQDAENTPGFLFYAPFYKQGNISTVEGRIKNFQGLVYAPLIMKRLAAGTLKKENRQVALRIMDGNALLYDEFDEINGRKKHFSKVIEVMHYGRSWNFYLKSKPSFDVATKSNQPLIILLGGLLIDSILFALFYFLSRSNKRAIEFGNAMAGKYEGKIQELQDKEMELSEAREFQDLVINKIPSYVFVKDKDFKIVQANQAFMNLYPEDKRDKIIGYTTVEEYDPEQVKVFLENDCIALNEGYHATNEEIMFPDGEARVVYTQKIGFDNAGERFILGVSHDITEMKKAEDEILRSNLELERFAYIASHDLQEPLRMILSFTSLLQEEYADNFDETGERYMKFVTDASAQMQMLVNDLLEYSRLGDDTAGLEEVDVNSCASQAIENLKEAIAETDAKVTFEDLPKVNGVQMRFTRLLQNLIGNAIKYRAPDRNPEVHISCEESAEEWIFSIADNGIGIKEEYLDKIFVIFKRLHNRNEYQGTGIGLSVCQKIVESFGGRIYATSEIGKGSKFIFTIPK